MANQSLYIVIFITTFVVLLSACLPGTIERSKEQAELDRLKDSVAIIELYEIRKGELNRR